jgi:hypothetical protein
MAVLCILLHGFPEGEYSWRQQFPAPAAAGDHAVAPICGALVRRMLHRSPKALACSTGLPTALACWMPEGRKGQCSAEVNSENIAFLRHEITH